jgi:5-methylcytosine-specific restriction endonuclease McrA
VQFLPPHPFCHSRLIVDQASHKGLAPERNRTVAPLSPYLSSRRMPMRNCLVLNKHFYAIQICDWKKAVTLLYQNHAQAVDLDGVVYSFEDWLTYSSTAPDTAQVVHSPSMRIVVPDVIRLTVYSQLPKGDVRFTRRNLYEHYDYKCCYCGHQFNKHKLNLDHIIPRSRGGPTSWKNMVPSCIPCNSKKGDRTPHEAGMPLLIAPSRPTWRGPQEAIIKSIEVCPPAWEKFLDKQLMEQHEVSLAKDLERERSETST